MEKNRLPCRLTNQDYVYAYVDPEDEFIKDVEAIMRYRFEYPSCAGLAQFAALSRLPKKKSGKLEDKEGIEGYGIQAISAWCFWKACFAFPLVQVPALVFAIRWLIGHAGDLQNAFMVEAVLLAALNILVVQRDRENLPSRSI